jgi:hypothetical protein
MPEPAVHVEGIAEARAAFRRATGTTKDLSKAHREVSRVVQRSSRSQAKGGTRQQARAAAVLLAKGSSTAADLAIRNTGRVPFGLGAFLGGKRPQFPEWVGNRWDILSGGGPYIVGDAIRGDMPEILETFEQQVAEALRSAGLETTIT